ncbi:hypothetical protein BH23PLA1_BH23PLA1_32100 [soil metagenome]
MIRPALSGILLGTGCPDRFATDRGRSALGANGPDSLYAGLSPRGGPLFKVEGIMSMSDIDALLRRILDARPHPVDLDADELDLWSAYLAALPPVPPGPPSALVSFSASTARGFPSVILDPAGTERLRRRHLEYVRLRNLRRLEAQSRPPAPVAEAPADDPDVARAQSGEQIMEHGQALRALAEAAQEFGYRYADADQYSTTDNFTREIIVSQYECTLFETLARLADALVRLNGVTPDDWPFKVRLAVKSMGDPGARGFFPGDRGCRDPWILHGDRRRSRLDAWFDRVSSWPSMGSACPQGRQSSLTHKPVAGVGQAMMSILSDQANRQAQWHQGVDGHGPPPSTPMGP